MPTIPILNVQTNALDALLAALGYRLSYLAKQGNDESFNKLLQNKNAILQFSSTDGVARYFRFQDGKVIQTQGTADTSDLIISFKNSTAGAKLLLKGDTAALMSAIQDGEVVVTGDFKLILWFASLAKLAVKIPDEYKPYLHKAKPYLNKAKTLLTKIKNS